MAPGRLDSMGSTIGVKISSRRICELSKCREGPFLKMIFCPEQIPSPRLLHTLGNENRSTINAGSDRWPVRLQKRVRWSSALRLNIDSSLKIFQTVTLDLRSAKIQSTLP
ncbi:hypothetical protein TNCV_3808081 [Trichonephila clavipes]|nr:hypothetical protein TNCV_3808081 [Trichonephila clavipes]